jgi:predicted carbohydrate-binding protein with CBM5 and CBM33 domain
VLVRRLSVIGLLALVSVPAVPTAAVAHGAPVTPISRSAACGGNGVKTSAKACVAARKATGGFLGAYDNVRLPNVNGKDRSRVPDGQLCSAGIELYQGLDLARDDFPATEVKSGQRLSVSYRGTIPHRGSFRLYLTRTGYDPGEKLTWDDLGEEPLADIEDPPLTDGAYRMKVTLPKRTGRHLLYVVWETSNTPDTYYSCSDLEFPEPVVKKAVAEPATPKPASAAPSEEPAAEATAAEAGPVESGPAESGAEGTTPAQTSAPDLVVAGNQNDGTTTLGHWLILGALTTAALVAVGAAVNGIRRRRSH